jgi:hypothetical protein
MQFSQKKRTESLVTSTVPYNYPSILCTTIFTRNYFPKKKERIGRYLIIKEKKKRKTYFEPGL